MKSSVKRVFLIVLDSFGIGAMPDAAAFGDGDCNTLRSLRSLPDFAIPNLCRMGLYRIDGVVPAGAPTAETIGSFARMQEASRGKDTTTGHWEIAGIVSRKPFPTYPNGFPEEILRELEKRTGHRFLCNKPYSGTAVIHDYGQEHLRTGALICYTSADSVFQLAAHESIVPREELYRCCRIARALLQGEHGVGRVIARPFTGSYPDFVRTSGRHDFSLEPPQNTLLDSMKQAGLETLGVGKIHDIFAGRGLTDFVCTVSNADGMEKTDAYAAREFRGLCFVNLVDFDMLYGHRRDVRGYADAMMAFDRWLGGFLTRMREGDLIMITADHGCDPLAPGTDHTREYVPLLISDKGIGTKNLGTLPTFSAVNDTILEVFGLPHGEHSVAKEIFYEG